MSHREGTNDAMSSQIDQLSIQDVPEYNILLLGETGAGKSTSINAIANYLKYVNFEDAKNSEFVHLIPSKFVMPDPDTGKPTEIKSGTDENENQVDGNSSTKDPRAYHFRMNDWKLRIIDTPGMGDTSGIDVDKKNFEKILNHLNRYEKLHGICFLIKSTETRKNAYFKYCITELLAHLHISACTNIVFCFTFSRNSFYGPGDGYNTLNSFLVDELKKAKIELEKGKNCFFIDNEAYRFLVAQKKGHTFPKKTEDSYHQSWNESVGQTTEMWNVIKKLPPHELNDTVSLNKARTLILQLAQPIVELQNKMNINMAKIEYQKKHIEECKLNKEELKKSLYLDVEDLRSELLPYPTTVCTSSNCTSMVKTKDETKKNYKTRCHEGCGLSPVQTNIVGHEILRQCTAMAGTLNCIKCKCPWQMHMHISCKYVTFMKPSIDENKQREIDSTDNLIQKTIATVREWELIKNQLAKEKQIIEDITSKFASFLMSNSITPYNNFILPYLDHLIDQEKQKCQDGDYPRTTLKSLENTKKLHLEKIAIIKKAIANKSTVHEVKLADIYKYRDQLYALPESGSKFRKLLREAESIHKNKEAIREKNLDFRQKISETYKAGKQKINNFITGGKQSDENKQPTSLDYCFLCEKTGHSGTKCQFQNAKIRVMIANVQKLCPICIIPDHKEVECRNKSKCTLCGGKHADSICTLNV